MTTATKHITSLTKAPSSLGTFEGTIDANPPEGDADNERIESWANVPGTFPLGYQHAYGDPGAEIGTVSVMPKGDGRHLLVLGRLDLTNPMAQAVHERMLLPLDDPMVLAELSVGISYSEAEVRKDARGVRVLTDVFLNEVSVVAAGAQVTSITNVKANQNGHTLVSRVQAWAQEHGAPEPMRRELVAVAGAFSGGSPQAIKDLLEHVVEKHQGKARAPRAAFDPEIAAIYRELDALESGNGHKQAPDKPAYQDVDSFVAGVKSEMAEEQRLLAIAEENANRARLGVRMELNDPGGADRREAERHQRELDEIERRDAERQAERLQREASDAARREAAREDPLVFGL